VASACGFDLIAEKLLTVDAPINSKAGVYGTALAAATLYGHGKTVAVLLAKGADVNTMGPIGTLLWIASARGYTEIAQKLLERGAKVDATGGECGTALYAASAYGHTDIVTRLFAYGADPEAVGGKFNAFLPVFNDSYYRRTFATALHAASWKGCECTVAQLILHGANVNTMTGIHCTAL